MKPIRIQRQRTKGWHMPENTVYVGRGSRFGNPFRIGRPDPLSVVHKTLMDAATCCQYYRQGIEAAAQLGTEHSIYHPNQDALWWAWQMVGDDEGLVIGADLAVMIETEIYTLKGKNLACWCPLDQPCHADILLEKANGKGPLL